MTWDTKSEVFYNFSSSKFEDRRWSDDHDEPRQHACDLCMFRAHVAPSEEGENNGNVSVDADAHDEENTAIEVATEEEAF